MRRLVAGLAALALQACGTEPSTCPENMGIDIENFVTDAYNAVVRQTGGGSSLNLTWSCPAGGTATITGSANTATVSFDLTFTFHTCSDTTTGSLTLDGALRDQTTNGGTLAGKTENVHSDALKIYGHSIGCNADPIDATCVVDITNSTTEICGLTYP